MTLHDTQGYSVIPEAEYVFKMGSKIPINSYFDHKVRTSYEYIARQYYAYCTRKDYNMNNNNAFPCFVMHVKTKGEEIERKRLAVALVHVMKANIAVADMFSAPEPAVQYRPIRKSAPVYEVKSQVQQLTPEEEKEAKIAISEQKKIKDTVLEVVAKTDVEVVYDIGGGNDVILERMRKKGICIRKAVISIDRFNNDKSLQNMNFVDYSKLCSNSLFIFNQSLYHLQPSVLNQLFVDKRKMIINGFLQTKATKGPLIQGVGYDIESTPSMIENVKKMSGNLFGRKVHDELLYDVSSFKKCGYVIMKYMAATSSYVSDLIVTMTNIVKPRKILKEQMPDSFNLKLVEVIVPHQKHKPNIINGNKIATLRGCTPEILFADMDLYQTLKGDGVAMTLFEMDKKIYLRDRKGNTFVLCEGKKELMTSRQSDSVLSVELFNYDFVPEKVKIVINSVLKSDASIFSLDFLEELVAHRDMWNEMIGHHVLGNKFYAHTFNSGLKLPETEFPYDGVVYVPVLSSSNVPVFAQTHYYFKQFESSDVNHRTIRRWDDGDQLEVAYWNGSEISPINPYSYDQIVLGKEMPYLFEGHHVPKEYFADGEIYKTEKDLFLVTNIRCDKYRYDSELVKTTLPATYGISCFTQFECLFSNESRSSYLYSFLRNLSRGRKILVYPSSVGISPSFVDSFLRVWKDQLISFQLTGKYDVKWKNMLLMKFDKNGKYDKIRISELLKQIMLHGYEYKTAVLVVDYLNRYKSTEVSIKMETGKFEASISFDVLKCVEQGAQEYKWDKTDQVEEKDE